MRFRWVLALCTIAMPVSLIAYADVLPVSPTPVSLLHVDAREPLATFKPSDVFGAGLDGLKHGEIAPSISRRTSERWTRSVFAGSPIG